MVQDVGEYGMESQGEALRDLEALHQAHVEVPVRKTAEDAIAAVSGIEPKDGIADLGPRRIRIGEDVQAFSRRTDVLALHTVVHRGGALAKRRRQNRGFVAEEVGAA